MGTTGEGITEALAEWGAGNAGALQRLMPRVVDELRRLARSHFRREAAGHTLQPTALVNELYLKLLGQRQVRIENRTQFFAFASRLMRRILVDHLRGRQRAKRGGGETRIPFGETAGLTAVDTLDILELDDTLQTLHRLDPRQHQIAEMHLFGGLSVEETAEALKISPATVKRDWMTAIAWLRHELRPR